MLPPKIMSSKANVIFDQNPTQNITVSLHFNSHLLLIFYHQMTKKVETLISIMSEDVNKNFNNLARLEAGKFVEIIVDT